jgi:hypothetical protein
MNEPIDLTKGRKQISHTIYPNGVRGDYYPPGFKIQIPVANDHLLEVASWEDLPVFIPDFGHIELTPREYYESEYVKK